MGQSRRGERTAGKSDEIDAQAVARAVVKDGVERFPTAYLDERAMEIRLLSDHRAMPCRGDGTSGNGRRASVGSLMADVCGRKPCTDDLIADEVHITCRAPSEGCAPHPVGIIAVSQPTHKIESHRG
jgi:hypothetical protein